MSEELPSGWALETVGDVAHFVRGVTYSKQHSSRVSGSGLLPVLRANNIGNGLNFDDLVFVPDRFVSEEQIVREGDLVLAMSSGSKSVVGKAAIARSPQRCGFGAFCGVIRPSEHFHHSLLGYYFQTKSYRNAVSGASKGVNINNLKAEHILDRPLRIPPAAEQGRIADKIDELFSRIDEGERALDRVQKLVERYRQSVLKAAVTGELTREWREKQTKSDAPIETGDALLARILTARREAWEKAELDKMKAKGVKPKNDRWKQKYTEPPPPDTVELPELPVGWAWASLDAMCSLITSGSRGWSQHYADTGSLFIRAQNIKRDVLELDDVAFVDLAGVTEGIRTKVTVNDLLITITGANVTKTALVTSAIEAAYVSQHVGLARPVLADISQYLFRWIVSPANGRAALLAAAYGAGKPGLSLEDLKELAIALPPQAEQEVICDLLDIEFVRIESITTDAKLRSKAVLGLRQAILKEAFSGNLIPQDPTDEPASALLERIAAEYATSPSTPKRGPKTKKKAAK